MQVAFRTGLTVWASSSAFKHAQNVWLHIILYMLKVSSGHFLSIEKLWYPTILLADSKVPDQTVQMLRVIWVFAVWLSITKTRLFKYIENFTSKN